MIVPITPSLAAARVATDFKNMDNFNLLRPVINATALAVCYSAMFGDTVS